MDFRISILLSCAILVGFATATQYTSTPSNVISDDLYIDDETDIEGSGGGKGEVKGDLEASGSGPQPEDDDDEDNFRQKPRKIVPTKGPSKTTTLLPSWKNTDDIVIDLDKNQEDNRNFVDNSDIFMNTKPVDRPASFFAQPGILAAVIGGAVVGLLCAILVVMFIVYRMRKKDEPNRCPPGSNNAYSKCNKQEFYA